MRNFTFTYQTLVSDGTHFNPIDPDFVLEENAKNAEVQGAYEGLIYWNKTSKKIEAITSVDEDNFVEDTISIPDISTLENNYLSKNDYIDRYQTPSYASGLQIATAQGSGLNSLYVPKAGTTQLGVLKVGGVNSTTINNVTTTSGKSYYLQVNSDGVGFVNVPWENTHVSSVDNLSGGTIKSDLTVDGSVIAKGFYESSDERYKTQINEIEDTDNIPTIKSFVWKDSSAQSYGFIAQEVEKNYPELVNTKADGYKTVNYDAALCLVVGKLQKEIEILKEKVAKLEA